MSTAESEDIVQDVLISVHRAKHTYDSAKPFGPWLIAIIKRRLIDRYRSEKRFIADNIDDFAGQVFSPESLDDKVLVQEILGSLSPEQAQALLGTEIHGLSGEEMAERLKMNPSALRVMVHRTLKAIRKAVEI